jgi:hypothetical protein
MKQYYTVIIFFYKYKQIAPRKYHNISNIENFKQFAATSGADYFNCYDKVTKQFKGRYYC